MKAIAIVTTILFSIVGYAGDFDPTSVALPWRNGPEPDSRYMLGDHPEKVHVLEFYALNCGPCNDNAPLVKIMAAEFEDDPRVQFLDIGLDTEDWEFETWIARHEPNIPVIQDEGFVFYTNVAQSYYTPQTLILDCTGTLIDWTYGIWDAADESKF